MTDPIDDLLAQVKAECDRETPTPTPNKPTPSPSPTPQRKDLTDRLLDEVRDEFADRDRAAAIAAQARQKRQQQQEEERHRQQRQQFAKQAQLWLQNLEPLSTEGIWFEEFASSYPTKIEAAIDYLQALAEVRST